MTKALIDGDICVYRVGFTTQDEPVGIAISRVDTLIDAICFGCSADSYDVFLTSTDHSNYRYQVYPEYKANRKAPKPVWYEEIRAHLISKGAIVVFNQEADDALGIAQTDDTVICSIDKDLDQIPGRHYDFVKDIQYEVSEERALRFFYFQLLTGDTTDNIPGVQGVGPKTADKILSWCRSVEDYEKAVIETYQRVYKKKALQLMTTYGQCLKIKRKEDEPLWLPAEKEQQLENEVS